MKRKKGLKKLLIMAVTLFLGILIISAAYFYEEVDKLNNNSKIASRSTENKSAINILVMGVDIGTLGSNCKNNPKRTDTMILIHYDKNKKEADAISIPRDTLIKLKGRNAKINAAHAVGGVRGAIDAVENLLDVGIDYYGKINYEGFREIIDAIGGVDVDIKNNMDYDDEAQNLHIHFKKGEKVHLDGKKAEEFFRWRKNNDGSGLPSGDLGRIDNQHIFISKVVEKVKSPFIIFRIPSILTKLPKYVETNMSSNEILEYGYALATADNIKTETLNGSTKYIGKASFFIYSKNKNKDIIDRLQSVSSTKGEFNNRDIRSFKVEVLNGTKKQGLASNYKRYIEDRGYKNIVTGNTTSAKKSRVIVSSEVTSKQMKQIKDDFDIKFIKKNSNSNNNADIVVILGEDQEYKN